MESRHAVLRMVDFRNMCTIRLYRQLPACCDWECLKMRKGKEPVLEGKVEAAGEGCCKRLIESSMACQF